MVGKAGVKAEAIRGEGQGTVHLVTPQDCARFAREANERGGFVVALAGKVRHLGGVAGLGLDLHDFALQEGVQRRGHDLHHGHRVAYLGQKHRCAREEIIPAQHGYFVRVNLVNSLEQGKH